MTKISGRWVSVVSGEEAAGSKHQMSRRYTYVKRVANDSVYVAQAEKQEKRQLRYINVGGFARDIDAASAVDNRRMRDVAPFVRSTINSNQGGLAGMKS